MRELLRQGLRRLVSADTSRYTSGRRRAIVIALSSQKGGVGKTTTAVSLGAALARFHSMATLIIDMDAQGHVERSLRGHVSGTRAQSLSHVLLSSARADVLDAVVDTSFERLHITAADRGLNDTETLMSTKIGKELILRDAIKYTRTHYDVILIDCPPNLGTLTLNGLVGSDYVLVPCDASPLAIAGVHDIVRTMATINDRLNRGLDLLGVLLTRIDGRTTTVNQAVQAELLRDYGDLLLDCPIHVNASLSKAQFEGMSIFDYAPTERAAEQYRALADNVVARLFGITDRRTSPYRTAPSA